MEIKLKGFLKGWRLFKLLILMIFILVSTIYWYQPVSWIIEIVFVLYCFNIYKKYKKTITHIVVNNDKINFYNGSKVLVSLGDIKDYLFEVKDKVIIVRLDDFCVKLPLNTFEPLAKEVQKYAEIKREVIQEKIKENTSFFSVAIDILESIFS